MSGAFTTLNSIDKTLKEIKKLLEELFEEIKNKRSKS